MGLISGMVMGVMVGVALMAGWSRVMRRRSTKRVAKVRVGYLVWLGLCCAAATTARRPDGECASASFSLRRGVGSFSSGVAVRLGFFFFAGFEFCCVVRLSVPCCRLRISRCSGRSTGTTSGGCAVIASRRGYPSRSTSRLAATSTTNKISTPLCLKFSHSGVVVWMGDI